jgi:hypothetical protein
MLGAQGLWTGRDLYRATPVVTRGLGFSGVIRRTAPFSRLLRHTRECGESVLTWILTGPISVASYDTQRGCGGLILTQILTDGDLRNDRTIGCRWSQIILYDWWYTWLLDHIHFVLSLDHSVVGNCATFGIYIATNRTTKWRSAATPLKVRLCNQSVSVA